MHEQGEHAEIMLVASLAALFLGPVIHRFADREGRVYSLLDGFVVVAVLGLALLEIVLQLDRAEGRTVPVRPAAPTADVGLLVRLARAELERLQPAEASHWKRPYLGICRTS